MDDATAAALMVPGDLSLDDLVRRPAWQRRAACRGKGTTSFFPAPGDSLAAARAVCDVCTVRSECLAMALADPGLQGFWGGTSERERQRIRRERRGASRHLAAADLALPTTASA